MRGIPKLLLAACHVISVLGICVKIIDYVYVSPVYSWIKSSGQPDLPTVVFEQWIRIFKFRFGQHIKYSVY